MTIEVWRSDDPKAVMDRAGGFLRSEPVLHNLILTLLRGRIARPEAGRYWVALDHAHPIGVAFQSPLDFPVLLTPMPAFAVDEVVAAIVADGIALPGVNGDAATAARFAGQWTERSGTAARPEMGMRLYELGVVREPEGVAGAMRMASAGDHAAVVAMVEGFHRDTGENGEIPAAEWTELRVAAGHVWVWDDDGPVAMAAHTAPVADAVRIQAVYTPPELRRRGYAGAVVAGLSRRLVDDGSTVLLYTDLGNPVSNSVYRRIGFRAVAEHLRYAFES